MGPGCSLPAVARMGPSYLPLLNSCSMALWKMSWCTEMLSLLGGMNVCAMYLIAALRLYCKLIGRCLYLLSRLFDSNMVCHSLVWYGVLVWNPGLCEPAGLGSVVMASVAGASVPCEVQVGIA
jgi:hypothetical protein